MQARAKRERARERSSVGRSHHERVLFRYCLSKTTRNYTLFSPLSVEVSMTMGRLLLLMLIPALAFAQQQYYGTTATSVRISADGDSADLERLPIRSGETITSVNVRNAIEVLFSTGRYRSVEVDAVPSGSGTQLTFNVVPHYFFSTFSLDPPNILDRPISSIIRLPVGQKFSEARLQEVVEQTEKALQDSGYFEPVVTSTLGSDNARRLRTVALRAVVKARARVDSPVRIQGGEGVLTPAQIHDALHVSAGDIFNANQLDKGLAAIQILLSDKGFLNTPVTAETAYNASTNTVRLDVKIDAGQETIIDTGGHIPEDEIRKLLPIFEEGAFDDDLVREGRARIVEYEQQQGYFQAKVERPDITPASAGNPLRIAFRIDQGERHKVRSIRFQGNTVFTDAQLRERLKVRAAGFPGFLTHGLLSDQLLETDIQAIRNMYRRLGYEAAFVESNRTEINHEIDLVFEITENQRYPVEQLTIAGNRELPESELRTVVKFGEGDFYSPAETGDARTALMAHYYEQGFPDVHVEASADLNPATGGRRITYQISEGRRYRVGSLYVTGNRRTAEKLIKRASNLKEYAFFNPEDILRAQQKLYSTGLFTRVDVVPLDQESGELRTVLIQVEEAKAIVLTPGIGVSEDTSPRVTLDISHNNLLGGDRSLGLRLRFGVNERLVQTTYREPRLFNRESLDGFGTLTVERTEQRSYQAKRLELSLQVRKRLTANNSFLTTASYQRVDLKDFKLSPVVRRLIDLKGVIYISKFGASIISDHRDNAVDPKRGMYNTSTFQIADKRWGSEVDFVSVAHQSSLFKPAGVGTLALSARAGWKLPYGQSDELPITERYFAGGSTTLRGFGLDEAGPPGGGQLLAVSNVEYRVPIRKLSIGELGAALFYDTGNVFGRPRDFSFAGFTHSAGPGLRFQTPLGPVRVDVGFNLHPRKHVQTDGPVVRETGPRYPSRWVMRFDMKRRLIFTASFLAILAAAQPVLSEIIDRIAVVIDNSFIITLSDIRKERAIQHALGGDPGDDNALIESLIEKHLVEEQIALFREVAVDEQAVNERLRGIHAPTEVSAEELRAAVRAELRRYEFTIQRFRPFIRVSDEELLKYFEEIAVPALRKNGQPIPSVEQGMLDVRPNVVAERMNAEVSDWLADLRRRTTIEKILK